MGESTTGKFTHSIKGHRAYAGVTGVTGYDPRGPLLTALILI